MTTLNKLLRTPFTPLAVIALSVAGGVGFYVAQDDTEAPPSAVTGTYYVEAAETSLSTTATDWAGAADVVVNAVVTDETRLPSPESETEVGTTTKLIGRTITVNVTDVLWRSPKTDVPRPTTITMQAFGWMEANDGSTREVAIEGSPRLEVGHRYVLALVWQPAECGESGYKSASWTWIGSGGVVPADGGVLGAGESEGTTQTVAETRTDAEAGSVEAANVGSAPAAVKDDLQKADDTAERTWPEPAAECVVDPGS